MATDQLEENSLLNGRYEIRATLGRGGMGTVYLAEHVRLNAIVAVKEVRGVSADEEQNRIDLDRCEQEARFLVRLNHPHLPKVTDAFIENDRFYLVMEYIEGVTLETRLLTNEGRPLDVAQVVEWALQIADVLAYLHMQEPPIIFRDLKPANVMVQPDGNIRLIDFGIARRFQPGASKDTSLLGSVGYSPPEQFGRHQTDTRSDIYALGATLHHLLTGRDPAVQPFKFPPARSLNPLVPVSLSRLLENCLAIDSDARPSSVNEVAARLLAVRDELIAAHGALDMPLLPAAAPAVPAPPPPRIISSKLAAVEGQRRRETAAGTRESASRMPLLAITLILAVLIGAGGTAYWSASHARPKQKIAKVKPIIVPPFIQPILPPITEPQPDPIQPSDPSNPGANDLKPPIANAASVQIMSDAQSLITDDPNNYLLAVSAVGSIQGYMNSSSTVAVYFYDGDGKPILAVNPKGKYADNGQLYVANDLAVTDFNTAVRMLLKAPLSEFPQTAFAATIQFRFRVFIDGKLVKETALTPLPTSIFTLPLAHDPNSQQPANPDSMGSGVHSGTTR